MKYIHANIDHEFSLLALSKNEEVKSPNSQSKDQIAKNRFIKKNNKEIIH